MAAVSSGRSVMDPQLETQNGAVDRLKRLYPAVNEDKSPLPRAWSPKEKYNYIGLSQNNLRVHYKGKKNFQGLWFMLRIKCHAVCLFFRVNLTFFINLFISIYVVLVKVIDRVVFEQKLSQTKKSADHDMGWNGTRV